MNNELKIIDQKQIEDRIFTIRDKQVMLDRDLATLYKVETRVLNQAVKRNLERFPQGFMFQMSQGEVEDWKSQIVTSNKEKMGLRKLPYVFTEQGVAMLSAVLRSETAVQVSIQIIDAFVGMRKFLAAHDQVFQRLSVLERNQLKQGGDIDVLFKAIEKNESVPSQSIFYNGQFFDAYKLISDIIRTAEESIILIDNYVDDTVLMHLTKRKENIPVTIYTKANNPVLQLDVQRFNAQYPLVEVFPNDTFHDRFMIIDKHIVYHIGASLKDAGNKTFAFSKLEIDPDMILSKIENTND